MGLQTNKLWRCQNRVVSPWVALLLIWLLVSRSWTRKGQLGAVLLRQLDCNDVLLVVALLDVLLYAYFVAYVSCFLEC